MNMIYPEAALLPKGPKKSFVEIKVVTDFLEAKSKEEKQRFLPSYYYRIFINFCYFLFILPYRVVFEEGEYKIRHNLIHKGIWIILSGVNLMLSLLAIRQKVLAKIIEVPEVFFIIVNRFIWAIYCISFPIIFWKNGPCVLAVLNDVSQPALCRSPALKIRLLCVAAVLQGLIYHLVFNLEIHKDGYLKKYSGQIMYMYFLKPNRTALTNEEISGMKETVVYMTIVFDAYKEIQNCLMELFAFISALMVYEMCQDYYVPLFTSKKGLLQKYDDVYYKVLLNRYISLRDFIWKVNDASADIIFWVFIQIVSWISGSIVDVLDVEEWYGRTFMWSYYVYYTAMVLLAAETHYKIRMFKTVLLQEQYRLEHLDPVNMIQLLCIETTEKYTGLNGGKFFTVTYGFLGTAFSLIITYAIIMIQFKKGNITDW